MLAILMVLPVGIPGIDAADRNPHVLRSADFNHQRSSEATEANARIALCGGRTMARASLRCRAMTKKLSNIDIAQAAKMRRITDVAQRTPRHSRGSARGLWQVQGQDLARLPRRSSTASPNGKLVLVTAISPTPAGEGKTTTTVGLGDALNLTRQEGADLPARAGAGAGVRHEGRRRRRRLCAGRADGRHQPAFHRRLRRDRAG